MAHGNVINLKKPDQNGPLLSQCFNDLDVNLSV